MQSIIEALSRAGIAAATIDESRRLVAANARLREILGPAHGELIGTDIGNRLLPPLAMTSGGVRAVLGTDARARAMAEEICQRVGM